MVTSEDIAADLRLFGQGDSFVYGILDPCDDEALQSLVAQPELKAESLFSGQVATDFAAVSPYLIQLDNRTFQYILSQSAGTNWGVLVSASVGFSDIRQHLRKYLQVTLPTGDPAYFRFYDPGVLSTYLRSLTNSEAHQFFGPIRRFGVLNERVLSVFSPLPDLPGT